MDERDVFAASQMLKTASRTISNCTDSHVGAMDVAVLVRIRIGLRKVPLQQFSMNSMRGPVFDCDGSAYRVSTECKLIRQPFRGYLSVRVRESEPACSTCQHLFSTSRTRNAHVTGLDLQTCHLRLGNKHGSQVGAVIQHDQDLHRLALQPWMCCRFLGCGQAFNDDSLFIVRRYHNS